jgi:hypothetical protein
MVPIATNAMADADLAKPQLTAGRPHRIEAAAVYSVVGPPRLARFDREGGSKRSTSFFTAL